MEARFRYLENRPGRSPKLVLTAMIDVVFLLLIFFLMTFKITAPEGDFNVHMPRAAGRPRVTPDFPITVTLRAGADGRLAGIRLADRDLGNDFQELRTRIRDLVGDDAGPGAAEGTVVYIDCDHHLRYAYAIEAVTAVSGYVGDDGRIVSLVERIHLAPPSPAE